MSVVKESWNPAQYRPGLDVLRACAVTAVFVFHARHRYLPGGNYGVDLFFALSGFLISGLLVAEIEGTGRLALGAFYARRAVRLFPALFLVVAVLAASGNASGVQVCAALFYVANIVELRHGDLAMGNLLHTWSLSAEEQFYLVWPLLLLLAAKAALRNRWSLRPVVGVIALLGVVPLQMSGLRMGALLAGAALGVAMPYISMHISRQVVLVAGALAAVVLIGMMLMPAPQWWVPALVVPIITTVVVAGAASVRLSGPTLRWLLAPLVWVGRISYGIYLWHLPLYFLLPLGMSPFKRTVLVGTSTLVAASLSWCAVERPISRRWGRRFRGASASKAPA